MQGVRMEWVKMGKGGRRGKEKAEIWALPEPRRRLSSEKIAKGMVSSRRETLQMTRGRMFSAPCRGLRDTLKIQRVDLSNDLVQVAFDSDALLLNFVEGIDFA